MKKILMIGVSLMIFSSHVFGEEKETYVLKTHYPSIYGAFSKLLLVPQSSVVSDPCTIGNIYFGDDGKFQCCQDDGSGTGVNMPTVLWRINGDFVYLVNSANKKVGLGTKNPEFRLTLENDGGILAKGIFGSGVDLTSVGTGTRLIWYPKKAAFRAGYAGPDDAAAPADQWDDANIGDYSFAAGYGTKASDNRSVALGYGTEANNQTSLAMGYQSRATGTISVAMGKNTLASGENSFALGQGTAASDFDSFAMGFESRATATQAIAMGDRTTASGWRSMATGSQTTAAGTQDAVVMGYKTSSPSGPQGIAMGDQTIVAHLYAIAMGYKTGAHGQASTAMGVETNAGDHYSIAMGYKSRVMKGVSWAAGQETVAEEEHSVALGSFVRARFPGSFMFGRYNLTSGTAGTWGSDNPIFVIANGTSDINRKNAVTVLRNGNVGIRTDAPTSRLHIMGVDEYADNTTAIAAGLPVGAFYRTGDELKIVH